MAKTTEKVLSVDLLRIDAGTQCRVSINGEAVDDYTEIIESNNKWPFPPVDVFHDGSDYFVANGFHRTLAARRAKRASVPCIVHAGTAKDARIFGMTANDQHGLRMSRADKRSCVEWLIDNGDKFTQEEIALKAGTSKRFVQKVVADRKAEKAHHAPFQETATKKSYRKKKDEEPVSGEEESPDKTSQETGSRPLRNGTEKPEPIDLGKCPNCAGTKWKDGACSKCGQIHGEPSGGPDDNRVKDQRSKTVKTVEALMRAFDDLNDLAPHRLEHANAIATSKILLKTAREWQ